MPSMLLCAYKPPFVSSNAFLGRLKKQVGEKKGGYLGTLDPFAQGALVVGFGSYTKLFPHLIKSPKCYRATLWLGAKSESLDIENMFSISTTPPVSPSRLEQILKSMQGRIEYTPPKFSARHFEGQRAYKLAREGRDFELPKSVMEVFSIKLLDYNHPFVSFEVSVSEGGYVRSIGEIIAQRLGVCGALSSLTRLSEGAMSVTQSEGIRQLDVLELLPYPKLKNMAMYEQDMQNGKKLTLKNVEKGKYIVCFEEFFSIIEVFCDGKIDYILNRIGYADTLSETR